MTRRLLRITALAAVLVVGSAVGPALAHAETPARAHGKLCQNQSKKRVAGQRGTPFGRCVTAMGRLAGAQTRSPRRACRSLPRGTPYRRCVSAGTRLHRVGNGIDRAFVDDMIPHHQAAIEMANLAHARGQSAFVHKLASDIIRSQQAEITTMQGMARDLDRLGVRPRSLGLSLAEMGMDHDMSHLVAAEPFDPAFLTMMIPHHQGAINMSRVQMQRGTGVRVRQLAYAITAAQQREIQLMREALAGAPPSVEDPHH